MSEESPLALGTGPGRRAAFVGPRGADEELMVVAVPFSLDELSVGGLGVDVSRVPGSADGVDVSEGTSSVPLEGSIVVIMILLISFYLVALKMVRKARTAVTST